MPKLKFREFSRISGKWKLRCWTSVSQHHLRSAASHQLTVLLHWRVTYGGRAFAVAGLLTWISSLKHLCFLLPTALVFWQSSQKHSSSQSMQCIRGTGKDVLYKSTFYVTLHWVNRKKNQCLTAFNTQPQTPLIGILPSLSNQKKISIIKITYCQFKSTQLQQQ